MTRIGVLSDSHGRIEMTRRAVAVLTDRGAEMLLHLGDIGSEQVLDELVGHGARVVFGNCDWDDRGLARYAELVGIGVDHPGGALVVDDRRIVYTHGHLQHLMDAALADGVDYLLHGHTHDVRDERIGATRVVNPGALFRASRYTAALLEPSHDTLELIDLS